MAALVIAAGALLPPLATIQRDHECESGAMATFDVVSPPAPPPPPPAEPPRPRPDAGGSAPRPPLPRRAVPDPAPPERLHRTPAILPAPLEITTGIAGLDMPAGLATAGGGDGGAATGEGDGVGAGRGSGRPPVTLAPAVWIRRPSDIELRPYWPRFALKRRIDGVVHLSCRILRSGRVRDCRVMHEKPSGQGFGRAALAMRPLFEIQPVTRDGVWLDLPVIVPVVFDHRNVVRPSR